MNPKISLMHFLVMHLMQHDPEVLGVQKEMSHIEAASRRTCSTPITETGANTVIGAAEIEAEAEGDNTDIENYRRRHAH